MEHSYTTLLFDADETLFDFRRCEAEAIGDTFRCFGISVNEFNIERYSSINKELWESLERGEITKEYLRIARFERFLSENGFSGDAAAMSETYVESLSGQVFFIADATEVCRRLSERCRMYIITNGIAYVQRKRFEKSGLTKYFRDVFISEELGAEKPSGKFFSEAEKRIEGFDAEKTLVIGDSLTSDIAGAIGAGLDCCWFNPSGKTKPYGMIINYEMNKLTELYDIIKI